MNLSFETVEELLNFVNTYLKPLKEATIDENPSVDKEPDKNEKTSPRPREGVTECKPPETSAKKAVEGKNQEFIDGKLSSYFNGQEIELYQRTVSKNGHTYIFYSAQSKHGKKVDVNFANCCFYQGAPGDTISIIECEVQERNGYAKIYVIDCAVMETGVQKAERRNREEGKKAQAEAINKAFAKLNEEL